MILRKIRTEPTVPDCSIGCTAPILSNTVMAVVQDSNLISFSSTQLTTFQTVSSYIGIQFYLLYQFIRAFAREKTDLLYRKTNFFFKKTNLTR